MEDEKDAEPRVNTITSPQKNKSCDLYSFERYNGIWRDNSSNRNNHTVSSTSIDGKNEREEFLRMTTLKDDVRPPITSRVFLLCGNAGVGKTTLVHIAAKHAGYRPIEINASDDRSPQILTEKVLRAMESTLLVTYTKTASNGTRRPN
jgi:hypothetical protein